MLVVSIKRPQTLSCVRETNTFGRFVVLCGDTVASRPRIPDCHHQAVIMNHALNCNRSTLDYGRHSMPNRILHQRLKQHARYNGAESVLCNCHFHSKPATEPGLLNGEVLRDEGKLLRKWYLGRSVIVEGGSQKLADLRKHARRRRDISL